MTGADLPSTHDGCRPHWPPRASRIASGSRSRPTRCRRSSRSSAHSASPGRPKRSGSMPAHPARWSARSPAAGGPTRSATPGRTCPSATSTSSWPTASTSTSTRSARSSGSAGGRRGARSGSASIPGTGAGYNEHLEYAGDRPTKFGIDLERLDDAIAAARRHDLAIDTVHFHAGSGWLADGLDGFERALARASTRSASCGRPATRSPRSTSAAGSGRRPARRNARSISTPTRPCSPATSDRSA